MYYHYQPEQIADGIITIVGAGFAVLAALFVVLLLVVLAVGIAAYVLQALGLSTMARRQGIAHAWLAWVPVGRRWLLGALADRACARRGKATSYAVVLLTLSAAALGGGLGTLAVPLLGVGLGLAGLAAAAVGYMALYEVYRECAPTNAVVYLVLSILLPAQGVLLFLLRHRGPACAPAQPAAPDLPGWSPAQSPPPAPRECPPEHWGGIMQPNSSQPENDPREQEPRE